MGSIDNCPLDIVRLWKFPSEAYAEAIGGGLGDETIAIAREMWPRLQEADRARLEAVPKECAIGLTRAYAKSLVGWLGLSSEVRQRHPFRCKALPRTFLGRMFLYLRYLIFYREKTERVLRFVKSRTDIAHVDCVEAVLDFYGRFALVRRLADIMYSLAKTSLPHRLVAICGQTSPTASLLAIRLAREYEEEVRLACGIVPAVVPIGTGGYDPRNVSFITKENWTVVFRVAATLEKRDVERLMAEIDIECNQALASLPRVTKNSDVSDQPGGVKADGVDQLGGAAPAVPATKPKRSTAKGDARDKIIAALTLHHDYAQGGCLNLEPIGNNELARLADVSESTASVFFEKEFAGYTKYRTIYCGDAARLTAAIKQLRQEFSSDELFGRNPSGEGDRDDE